MRSFYNILVNQLIAGVTTSFVWFALTYWAYLQTKSVLATSLVSGIYLTANALSAFWFGSIVDHHKKKTAMFISTTVTLFMFSLGFIIFLLTPSHNFTSLNSVIFWVLIIVLLLGVIVSNIRNIALPTIVALLVPAENRDKANGLVGSVSGVAFAITSIFSGLVLAYGGMFWVLLLGVALLIVALIHLTFVKVHEELVPATEDKPRTIDVKGTLAVINSVPGLFALILFSTFNNLLGGVFMSLMDAYGLTLVSLQVWGFLWGFLSLGFIIGGIYVAKNGIGKNPLRALFMANMIMWIVSMFFTVQPNVILLAVGMFIWICLVPFAESSEQTIFQKVVPYERLGRVFGIAQSIESAASPVSAFLIGPLAQFIFIPFMTTGAGVDLIGGWFGTGQGRGIALVFTFAGIIGLLVTLLAMKTRSYKSLEQRSLQT